METVPGLSLVEIVGLLRKRGCWVDCSSIEGLKRVEELKRKRVHVFNP
jgi:hypothetical protein